MSNTWTGSKKFYRQKRHLYNRKGSCKQCGKCCNVRYLIKGNPLWLKMLLFIMKPRLLYGWIVNDNCPNLFWDNQNKAVCRIYPNRPFFCKAFPAEPDDLVSSECGFYFKKRK